MSVTVNADDDMLYDSDAASSVGSPTCTISENEQELDLSHWDTVVSNGVVTHFGLG